MIKKQLLKLIAKYTLSMLKSLNDKTEDEKKEILDTCNKISEVSWILASHVKGKEFSDYNKKIIADQLKRWSKGEPTLKDFKSLYR